MSNEAVRQAVEKTVDVRFTPKSRHQAFVSAPLLLADLHRKALLPFATELGLTGRYEGLPDKTPGEIIVTKQYVMD